MRVFSLSCSGESFLFYSFLHYIDLGSIIGGLIGGSIGALILIILIIRLCYYWCKCHKKKGKSKLNNLDILIQNMV